MEAIQYLSKYIEKLSANTNILRKLLKKQNERIWTDEHTEAFNKLKEGITKIPCLAHHNAQNKKIVITDASTKGLGATLCSMEETKRWKSKTSRICKQIFIGYRKEVRDKRIRITGCGVGIGIFPIIHIRKAN